LQKQALAAPAGGGFDGQDFGLIFAADDKKVAVVESEAVVGDFDAGAIGALRNIEIGELDGLR
jgi:hypothetical protein